MTRLKLLLTAFVAMAFVWCPLSLATSLSDDPRYAEVWKKSQVLNDKPSMDTTPVFFSVGGVNYKVPRNYIVKMQNWSGGSQDMVAFKVAFPGFEPLNGKTKDCLTLAPLYRPKGCVPIDFWIGAASSPELSDDDHFKNQSKLFHSQTPKQGPYGFELYETGPDNARIETYRKQTPAHTLLMDCIIHHNKDGKRSAICSNYWSPLPNHNTISYRLSLDQLKDSQKIDEGLRALAESFAVKGEKQ